MLSTDTIWNRRELVGEEISERAYNLTIGAVLLWGFFANYLMVDKIPPELLYGINGWILFLGYFALIIAGTSIYQSSDNPAVSFLGYNLIVLPLGLLLVYTLPAYQTPLIIQALLATGAVTGTMMLLAVGYPKFFLSIGRGLFIAFISVIIVEMLLYFITGKNPGIFDFLVVGIMAGYIGYDWARAQALPKTLDNAVDSAAALYVDIVILFLRLLRLFSRR
jgi:FtsH-binding integral membrane protein